MTSRFPDLVQIFDRLPLPRQNVGLGRFCAHPIPAFPVCNIAKDTDGCPALMIATDNALPGPVNPLVLERLRVIHMVNCRVQQGDGTDHDRTLSVVQCIADDRLTQEYFLRSLYPIIAALPACPSREDVTRSIDRLLELFRQMTSAPQRALSGLWAEMLVIAESRDPETLLRSWRSIPEEKFDFSAGTDRIDVKSSSGTRVHHFNLDQVRPPLPLRCLIVSILVERSQGGVSCFDLIEKIRSRVDDNELLIRLDQIVAETVGHDWRSLSDTRFAEEIARTTMRIINAAEIPSVTVPIPPEISGVHFKVDLTGIVSQGNSPLPGASSLFAALPCTATA